MLKIDDPIELSELHRAILEAKFHPFPTDANTAGSPVLAGVADRIYDELSSKQDKRSADIASFKEMRRIKGANGFRGQWRTAVMAARRDVTMSSASQEERLSLAKCYLSPFDCTEGELRAFLDDVDGKTGQHDIEKLFRENSFASAQLIDAAYSFAKQQAHIVFMLKDLRVCDIYFSGVKKFAFDCGGELPDLIMLKKSTVNSGKTQKLEASFSSDTGKITLFVEGDSTDCWI